MILLPTIPDTYVLLPLLLDLSRLSYESCLLSPLLQVKYFFTFPVYHLFSFFNGDVVPPMSDIELVRFLSVFLYLAFFFLQEYYFLYPILVRVPGVWQKFKCVFRLRRSFLDLWRVQVVLGVLGIPVFGLFSLAHVFPSPFTLLPWYFGLIWLFRGFLPLIILGASAYATYLFSLLAQAGSGFCYSDIYDNPYPVLVYANFQRLIDSETFLEMLSDYPADHAFSLSPPDDNNVRHISRGGFLKSPESAADALVGFVGMIGMHRVNRNANLGPISRAAAPVRNAMNAGLRSLVSWPVHLADVSTRFSFTDPLASRTQDFSIIEKRTIEAVVRDRNGVSSLEAPGFLEDVPAFKTSLSRKSKAVQHIEAQTGIVLVSNPQFSNPHEAAALLRVKFLSDLRRSLPAMGENTVLISPSVLEMHVFPLAVFVFIRGVDGFDVARMSAPCTCTTPNCGVRHEAALDGRMLAVDSLSDRKLVRLLSRFGADQAVMVHIEPNIKPKLILEFMVRVGIRTVYSLMNFAILPVFGRTVTDATTGHTFVVDGNSITCGFDSGTYSHTLDDFADIMRVVENGRGQWLKREISWEVDRTVACKLEVSVGDANPVAIAYRPSLHTYYVLPAPRAGLGIRYIVVHRTALDNVIGRLRTKERNTIEDIRAALRGSSVVITLTGANVTPRIDASADDQTALARFLYVYLYAEAAEDKIVSALKSKKTLLSGLNAAGEYSRTIIQCITEKFGLSVGFGLESDDLLDITSLIFSGMSFLPLKSVSGICIRRVLGPSQMRLKKGGIVHANFASVDSAIAAFAATSAPSLDTSVNLARSSARVRMASELDTVLAGLTFGTSLLTFCMSSLSSYFKSQDRMDKALAVTRAMRTFDFTVYSPAAIVRDIINVPAGDFLTIAAGIKTLFATIAIAQDEAAITTERTRREEEIEAAHIVFMNHIQAEMARGSLTDEIMIELATVFVEAFERDGELLAIFRRGEVGGEWEDGDVQNIRAISREAVERYLRDIGARHVPYQDFFHELVSAFSEVTSMKERSAVATKMLDSMVGTELASLMPSVRNLFVEVEKKVRPSIQAEEARVLRAENVSQVRTSAGDLLDKREIDVMGATLEGAALTVEEACASQGPILVGEGRDSHTVRFIGSGRGDVTDQDMTEAFGNFGDWAHNLGAALNRQSLPYVPTTEMVSAINSVIEQRANMAARTVSSLAPLWQEDLFAAEILRLNGDERFQNLFDQLQFFPHEHPTEVAPYIAHIRGLPMSKKSAMFVGLLTHEDIVVAPSTKLAMAWQQMFASRPRAQRPRILTQHKALTFMAARFIVVDEVYTLTEQHVIALGKCARQGIITVGDPTQIRAQFDENFPMFDPGDLPHHIFTSCVSFMPADAAIAYLAMRPATLIPGMPIILLSRNRVRSLKFVLSGENIVHDGLSMVGLQESKEYRIDAGDVNCRTAHECQGSRGDDGIVYLNPVECGFYQTHVAHLAVVISRCRFSTTFVVAPNTVTRVLPSMIFGGINGSMTNSFPSRTSAISYFSDEVDYEHWDEVLVDETCQNLDYKPGVYMENSFPEFIAPSSLVVDGVPLTVADMKNSVSEFSVDEISANVKMLQEVPFPKVVSDDYTDEMVTGKLFSTLGQFLPRASVPDPISPDDRRHSLKLMKRFFKSVASRRSIKQLFWTHYAANHMQDKTHDQVLSYLEAEMGVRAHTYAKTFPKGTVPKKTSDYPKTQNVTASGPIVQAVFARVISSLTFALAKGTKSNVTIDAFNTDEELMKLLSLAQDRLKTYSAEWDLDRQDSSHRAVFISFFSDFMREVGLPEELISAFEAVRGGERIIALDGSFVATSATALTSGAPWTLLSNVLMMIMWLLNEYEIPDDVDVFQKGDDFTANAELAPAIKVCPLPSVSFKFERNRIMTFTGKASVGALRFRKMLKFFLSVVTVRRTPLMHYSYQQAWKMMAEDFSEISLDDWMAARFYIFKIDPTGAEDYVRYAIYLLSLTYDQLPEKYKKSSESPSRSKLISKDNYCFYYSIVPYLSSAQLVEAHDLFYTNDVSLSRAVAYLNDNCLKYRVMGTYYPGDSHVPSDEGVVFLYNDHAVTRVPAEVLRAHLSESVEKKIEFML